MELVHFARKLETELTAKTAELEEAKRNLALVLEDRARFPDKPDQIGSMIGAHIGNLKAQAEHCENAWRDADTIIQIRTRERDDARAAALEEAAHELRRMYFDEHTLATDTLNGAAENLEHKAASVRATSKQ